MAHLEGRVPPTARRLAFPLLSIGLLAVLVSLAVACGGGAGKQPTAEPEAPAARAASEGGESDVVTLYSSPT